MKPSNIYNEKYQFHQSYFEIDQTYLTNKVRKQELKYRKNKYAIAQSRVS